MRLDDRQTRESVIQSVLSYIDRNFKNEISLDELAEYTNFSKFHLSRIFKQQTGMTVFEYANKRRINKAKNMFYTKIKK